jgi:DNA polymerase-3 subunit alpha (Gram-positive type)
MLTLIYDFETSGLNPFHEDITEIGCKCLETGKAFTCLLKPLSDKLLSEKNQEITGITNKLLHEKGLNSVVAYQKFFDFLLSNYTADPDLVMIAHNGLTFDDIFLKRMHRYLQENGHSKYDIMMDNIKFVDSLLLSRLLHPERYSHSMKGMCQLYNVQNKAAHRAMGDVDALSEVWVHLMDRMKRKGMDTSGTNLRHITYC